MLSITNSRLNLMLIFGFTIARVVEYISCYEIPTSHNLRLYTMCALRIVIMKETRYE